MLLLSQLREEHIQELMEVIEVKEKQIKDHEEYIKNKSYQLESSLNEIMLLEELLEDHRKALLSKEAKIDFKDAKIAALLEKHEAEIRCIEAEMTKQREEFKKHHKKVKKDFCICQYLSNEK